MSTNLLEFINGVNSDHSYLHKNECCTKFRTINKQLDMLHTFLNGEIVQEQIQ